MMMLVVHLTGPIQFYGELWYWWASWEPHETIQSSALQPVVVSSPQNIEKVTHVWDHSASSLCVSIKVKITTIFSAIIEQ